MNTKYSPKRKEKNVAIAVQHMYVCVELCGSGCGGGAGSCIQSPGLDKEAVT